MGYFINTHPMGSVLEKFQAKYGNISSEFRNSSAIKTVRFRFRNRSSEKALEIVRVFSKLFLYFASKFGKIPNLFRTGDRWCHIWDSERKRTVFIAGMCGIPSLCSHSSVWNFSKRYAEWTPPKMSSYIGHEQGHYSVKRVQFLWI